MSTNLIKLRDKVINDFYKKCNSFESELRTQTPIDTGAMISSWHTIQHGKDRRVIYNLMPYSPIIARGRVFLKGRWYGSLKGWGRNGVKGLLKKHFKEGL